MIGFVGLVMKCVERCEENVLMALSQKCAQRLCDHNERHFPAAPFFPL